MMTKANTEQVTELFADLYPITRSLTGDGVRQTLNRLSDVTPLSIQSVPSGKSVYDWEVPPEWNIRDAYIADSSGERVVDFKENNIHIVNYSVPVDKEIEFDELQDHLHTLPEMPDAIPYRTTYYERNWGFCLRHNTLETMDEDETYHVYIDSDIDPNGELTYADAKIEGKSDQEYIISTYCCHPSLANDNLSGLVLAALLFNHLRERSTYHSYRLIIVPETIGTISYLQQNEHKMKSVNGGYVITTVAGPGSFDYKASFKGDHPVDKAARWALADDKYEEHAFAPTGSDERQYSTPGFRIPTGTIAKDKYYEYDAYHTSKDDLSFISSKALLATLDRYIQALDLLEKNRAYDRVDPHCEFKLDRHNLHPTTGGQKKQP
jgi:aminopeptidase-like protein